VLFLVLLFLSFTLFLEVFSFLLFQSGLLHLLNYLQLLLDFISELLFALQRFVYLNLLGLGIITVVVFAIGSVLFETYYVV